METGIRKHESGLWLASIKPGNRSILQQEQVSGVPTVCGESNARLQYVAAIQNLDSTTVVICRVLRALGVGRKRDQKCFLRDL